MRLQSGLHEALEEQTHTIQSAQSELRELRDESPREVLIGELQSQRLDRQLQEFRELQKVLVQV